MKTCSKCSKNLPIINFSLSKNRKDGYYESCKNCVKEYNKNYYIRNKEKIKKDCILYKKENPNKVKEQSKNYMLNNRQKILDSQKNHYRNNIERHKQYNKDNRKKINAQQLKHVLYKLKTDPIYKLKHNIRVRIRKAFQLKKATKCKKSEELLGCSIKIAKKHLESKFLPTMTWENYGKYWHIDHIIPCSFFDLSFEEEQKKCFHYTNLQPLFAVTQIINGIEYIGNLNKGNKILN